MPGPDSERSSLVPGVPSKSGSSGPYVIGIVVLAALAGGLFYWKKKSAPPVVTPQLAAVTATAETPRMLHAPPPPPKIVEEEVVDAGAPAPTAKVAAGGAPGPGACSKCGEGKTSGELSSAIRGAAQSAQGCYQRALRTNAASGKMTVAVQVGSAGQVCGASIVNDSVGSAEISACVLGRFRGKTFPAPDSGCVSISVPISFTIKQ